MINIIKEKRKQLGLTQEDMAEAVGVNISSYGRIELGMTRINDDKLKKIAVALQTTPIDLLNEAASFRESELSAGVDNVLMRENAELMKKLTNLQDKYIQLLEEFQRLKTNGKK